MASTSPEKETLRKCTAEINKALTYNTDLIWFANCLFAERFITDIQKSNVQSIGVGDYSKASKLMESVMAQVSITPSKYDEFLGILEEEPALDDLVKLLNKTYGKDQLFQIKRLINDSNKEQRNVVIRLQGTLLWVRGFMLKIQLISLIRCTVYTSSIWLVCLVKYSSKSDPRASEIYNFPASEPQTPSYNSYTTHNTGSCLTLVPRPHTAVQNVTVQATLCEDWEQDCCCYPQKVNQLTPTLDNFLNEALQVMSFWPTFKIRLLTLRPIMG